MKLIPEIQAALGEIQTLRRTIHAPSRLLRYEETATGAGRRRPLWSWGIETYRGLGGTGVVGVLRRGSGKRSIGLRADMDALLVQALFSFEHLGRKTMEKCTRAVTMDTRRCLAVANISNWRF